ncbi:hypothetical protein [Hyphomicrobium sp. ghe19]|uniref:hypothetical protein n=1 Tax=Hyphomicrobium sp. ghe19 TaxID=2682968 RepID=UPI0013672E11|nr:hypothetical protein HYPP_03791 [Hyphomicrobium sp. ghe19]
MQDQHLRELQRQTRIMAEKEASRQFAGVTVLGFIGEFVWAYNWPHTIPNWPWVLGLGPFALGALAAVAEYRRHTRG